MSKKSRPTSLKEIEVTNKHLKLRVILLIFFIVLAVVSFTFGIKSCVSQPKGWTRVDSVIENDIVGDFTFYYYCGGGKNGNSELKAVTALYSQACNDAYMIFNELDEFDDFKNLAYINKNANKEIEIDKTLYKALEKFEKSGKRYIYLAPIYGNYVNIFYSRTDDEAKTYLPEYNEDANEFFSKVLSFANDKNAINLELLGENKVKLNVSGEYLEFAKNSEIKTYIDFFAFKNAFILDYVVDVLKESGCENGTLSTKDGYMRSVGESSTLVGIYDKTEDSVIKVADVGFNKEISLVRYRNFAINTDDYGYYYIFGDKSTLNRYIDLQTGKNKTSIDSYYAYSYEKGCVDIAFDTFFNYVSESFDNVQVETLKQNGVYSIYFENSTLICNDSKIEVSNLSKKYTFLSK